MKSKSKNRSGLVIAAAAFAAFLATFNETFLNVAFTPIMEDLNISVSTVQWLATAYMLGAAVMVPVSAFAYRKIPTKPLFIFTVGLLSAGSIIGAAAHSFPVLLSGRIIQSLGTGMLIPIGMNITLEAAPREKLGAYMGLMGAMTTLGPSLSIITAGVLLSVSNWHILLWVFAGLSLLLMLAGILFVGNIAKLTNPKLDLVSVILVGLALTGLLYGISTLFTGSFPVAAVSAASGLILLVLFILRQGRLAEPLIDLRPLKSKIFSASVAVNMISLIVIFAMNIVMPIFMQSALGTSSLSASVTLFPAILLSCIVAPAAGKIYDRQGIKNLLPSGFLLILIFTVLLTVFKDTGMLALMAVLYIPVICGSALIIGPIQSFALSRLEPELNPHGVTVMSTGFQIAGCIGSSIFTGVYSAVISGSLASGAEPFAAASKGFTAAGLLAAVFSLIGLVLSLYLRKTGKEKAKADQSEKGLQELMKRDVYTIHENATILDALKLITDKKISGVPVVDNAAEVVGFISDGDILRYLSKQNPVFVNAYSLAAVNCRGNEFYKNLNGLMKLKVSDAAVKKVITVDIDDGLDEVCRVLHEHRLKKVPVMENGKMVGIINSSNITKYALNICISSMKV